MITTLRHPWTIAVAHLATLGLCAFSASAGAQAMAELPFAPGERFEYSGRVNLGVSGRGTLRVEGPTELRGTTPGARHFDAARNPTVVRVVGARRWKWARDASAP